MRQNKTLDAIEKFRQTISIDPKHAKGHNNLGDALTKLGQLAEAQTEFEEAIRIQPDYHKARINLALVHRRRGANEEALAQCRIILQADPTNPAAQELMTAIQSEIEK
jgi:Tfp pilus assembly protein PilF